MGDGHDYISKDDALSSRPMLDFSGASASQFVSNGTPRVCQEAASLFNPQNDAAGDGIRKIVRQLPGRVFECSRQGRFDVVHDLEHKLGRQASGPRGLHVVPGQNRMQRIVSIAASRHRHSRLIEP